MDYHPELSQQKLKHISDLDSSRLINKSTNLKLTSSLGTSIEEEGGMETEIAKRVGAGWMNWKKCSGVLCDKRMPVKLKGKVYRTVVKVAIHVRVTVDSLVRETVERKFLRDST